MRPKSLAYLDLQPDNGGIVVDVSEDGLGFCAVAPVQVGGPIRIWFSLEVFDRLEAIGEFAWTDPSGKAGGLRFQWVPPNTRQRLQQWLGDASLSGGPGMGPLPQALGAPNLPRAEPENPEVSTGMSPRVGIARYAEEDEESAGKITWYRSRPTSQSFLKGIITGAFVVGIVAALAYLLISGRVDVRSWLHSSGGGAGTRSEQPKAPAAAAEPAHAVPPQSETPLAPSRVAPPADRATTESVPAATPVTPAPPAAGERGARTVPPADNGESELNRAREYLRGAGGERDVAAAVRLLWAALGKGNTTAEVLLAGLYARGDGVRKNCAQARVLLAAAAKKGDFAAGQELKNLRALGCP